MAEQTVIPPFFWIQIAIGLFLWVLILSPFQEFFFRGWLQPRLQAAIGKWAGLTATSMIFALWHLLPPFEEAKIVPIMSISPILYMTLMGFTFGYIRQRTKALLHLAGSRDSWFGSSFHCGHDLFSICRVEQYPNLSDSYAEIRRVKISFCPR
jgi:membrane protease YdiL (CAAX protease family)